MNSFDWQHMVLCQGIIIVYTELPIEFDHLASAREIHVSQQQQLRVYVIVNARRSGTLLDHTNKTNTIRLTVRFIQS